VFSDADFAAAEVSERAETSHQDGASLQEIEPSQRTSSLLMPSDKPSSSNERLPTPGLAITGADTAEVHHEEPPPASDDVLQQSSHEDHHFKT